MIGTSSVAQKGNFQSAFNGKMEKTSPWIIDLGASDHMTGDPNLFNQYSPCTGNFSVRIADGSLSKIADTGSVFISKDLTLNSVLLVPNSGDKLCCYFFSKML